LSQHTKQTYNSAKNPVTCPDLPYTSHGQWLVPHGHTNAHKLELSRVTLSAVLSAAYTGAFITLNEWSKVWPQCLSRRDCIKTAWRERCFN